MDLSVEREALAEAVKAVGSQEKLGKGIGKSQAHVWHWLNKGRLPAEEVLRVEEISGVSRHRLRPDIYPDVKAVPASDDQPIVERTGTTD